MQLISKFNKGFPFLLYVIDISKNTYGLFLWKITLRSTTITNAFRTRLKESNRKPKKRWIDKGSEFYNGSIKSFFQNNDIEMYSIHNEGKLLLKDLLEP